MIPCNPISYLDTTYGPNDWSKPEELKYNWNNLDANFSYWNDTEWPRVYRQYNLWSGLLEKNETLNYINARLLHKITDIND